MLPDAFFYIVCCPYIEFFYILCPREESNFQLRFRKPLLYPFNYEGLPSILLLQSQPVQIRYLLPSDIR